jgi:hypothetical protein
VVSSLIRKLDAWARGDAFALACDAASVLGEGWVATQGHREHHAGCSFLVRERDGLRFYVGARGARVLVRPVFPRDAQGRKLRADDVEGIAQANGADVARTLQALLPWYVECRKRVVSAPSASPAPVCFIASAG